MSYRENNTISFKYIMSRYSEMQIDMQYVFPIKIFELLLLVFLKIELIKKIACMWFEWIKLSSLIMH